MCEAGETGWRNTVIPLRHAKNAFSRIIGGLCGVQCHQMVWYSMSMAHATHQLPAALPNTKQKKRTKNNRHECAIYGKTCMWVNYYVSVVSFRLSWSCGLVTKMFLFFSPTICGAIFMDSYVHKLIYCFRFYEMVQYRAKGNRFFSSSKFQQMVHLYSI